MHGVILGGTGCKQTLRRQVGWQTFSATSAELLPLLLFTRFAIDGRSAVIFNIWVVLTLSHSANSVVIILKASEASRGSVRDAQPALAYYVSSCFAASLGQAVQ